MLNDKVVFVAGSNGRIGKKFSRSVLEKGGSVILGDINQEMAAENEQELTKEFKKENIVSVNLDINSNSSIQEAINISVKKFGKIDALVNSAYPRNANYGRHFFDVEYKDFCENVNLHLGGYFLLTQQFAKYFLLQGKGNIINISSVYGVIAPKFGIYDDTNMTMPVEYAAIKSSIIHLSSYIAKYLKNKNIRVNCVSPGGILDNQPASFIEKYRSECLSKGMLDTDDLMGILLFLVSDASKMINGQNIIIDDGFTL